MLLRLCEHCDKWIYIKSIFDKRKMFWMMKLTFETQSLWKNVIWNFNLLWFNINKILNVKKHSLCTKFMNDWITHWMIYQVKTAFPLFTQIETLSKKKLKWHVEFTKSKNSLITQIHIEKIDLIKFLYKRKIFDFFHRDCSCDVKKQMLKHIITQCFLNVKYKWNLKYNECEKLSTSHVNFQNNKNLDMLIY